MGSLTFISKHSLAGTPQPETVRGPEIEKVSVAISTPTSWCPILHPIAIAAAKAKLGKHAVILGYHSQRDEVVKFAKREDRKVIPLRSQRVRLHDDVSNHATAPAVGPSKIRAKGKS